MIVKISPMLIFSFMINYARIGVKNTVSLDRETDCDTGINWMPSVRKTPETKSRKTNANLMIV